MSLCPFTFDLGSQGLSFPDLLPQLLHHIVARHVVVNGRDGDHAVAQGQEIRSLVFRLGDLRLAGKPVIDILPRIGAPFEFFHEPGLSLAGDDHPLDVFLRDGRDVHVQGDAAVRVVMEHEMRHLPGKPGGEAEIGIAVVRSQRDGDGRDTQDCALRCGGNGPGIQDVDAHIGPEVDSRYDQIYRFYRKLTEADLDAVRRRARHGPAHELAVLPRRADHEGPRDRNRMSHGALFHLGGHDDAFGILRQLLVQGAQPPCVNPVIIGQQKSHQEPSLIISFPVP